MRRLSSFSSGLDKRLLPNLMLVGILIALPFVIVHRGFLASLEAIVVLTLLAGLILFYRWRIASELADEVVDFGDYLLIRRGRTRD